jgi:hypothetical protein
MARTSKLASMSVEALLQLRDDIGSVLSRKAGQLQTQLAALGDGGWLSSAEKAVGRPRGSKMKGRKLAPKYRNPKNRSETWVVVGIGGKLLMPAELPAIHRYVAHRESAGDCLSGVLETPVLENVSEEIGTVIENVWRARDLRHERERG